VNSTIFFYQDTAVWVPSDTASLVPGEIDSIGSLKKFSTEEVEDIFRAMEQKEREMDSIARVRARDAYLRSLEQQEPEGFDTASVPYNFDRDELFPDQNPLNHLSKHYISSKDTARPVFLEQSVSEGSRVITERVPRPVSISGPGHDLRPDWLLAIIIGSLVLLAWLKLFYNKFLDQTIQSIGNFQLSTKLLRDQNLFSRRVAFALNLNFILVGAAYIYLILGVFHIRFLPLNDILSYLIYALILSGLLILRLATSRAVGLVFRKQYEFREYQHQLLLIYKNLGVYLLILVIGIAYIREDFRIYLVFLSGLLVISAFIIRFIKGLKIVLNKKDVFIFYLILYLCTLEILPLLIFYRFFSSLISSGQA
jgi:hypothetical protein